MTTHFARTLIWRRHFSNHHHHFGAFYHCIAINFVASVSVVIPNDGDDADGCRWLCIFMVWLNFCIFQILAKGFHCHHSRCLLRISYTILAAAFSHYPYKLIKTFQPLMSSEPKI